MDLTANVFSSYQYGPDTYLLQLKDSSFPARLREYLSIAKQHSADFQDVKVKGFYSYRVFILSCTKRAIVKDFLLSQQEDF